MMRDAAMDLAGLTIEAGRLWPGEAVLDAPLAFINLDATREVPEVLALPPCPVIGLGDRDHPLAPLLDAVAEAPIGAEALARGVLAAPRAAAVVAELLRLLPGLDAQAGLTAESLAYAVLQGSAEHARWLAGQARAASPARSPGVLRLDRREDRLVLTLDHVESGNAIDRALRDQLHYAFALAAIDSTITRVSLRAQGRTFSLGAELGEFGTTADPATAHAIRARTLPARQAALVADRLDVHVQGGCVGAGLELAAWARRFTASGNAWFQLPELAMGILPGAGGCVSLTRRIGRQRTAALILSGKRLSARHALAWGLVDAIVDDAA